MLMIDGEEVEQKTVESFLQDIDYKPDPDYIPSEFAIEFITFIKMVNGEQGEEHPSPVVHYQMLDQVPGTDHVVNLCSRGLAKTTLLGEYLFLYLAVYGELPDFGQVDYALYVSDSIENGVKKMRLRIERRRENSEFLMKMIPTARFTDIRWYFKNIDGKEFVVTGHGAKTGVRGTVELNTRPQLAVLDDLISDEDARSATVIASVEDTVYKAIDYALHPDRNKIIWSGTPFNAKDPLYKAVESGAWRTNVFPVCQTFPCKEEEFLGAWAARFTYQYVKDKYQKALLAGKVDTFNQELMLRIMSDEDRLIKDHMIQWYSRKSLLMNRDYYNWFCTTDFASKGTNASDFSVISIWAMSSNGDFYWVDGVCVKQDMGENIDDLFRLVHEYQPMSVGIEVSGQQAGFIPWLTSEMLRRKIYFSLASDKKTGEPGIRPSTSTSKIDRFHVVVPWFKSHKMYFPEELRNSDPMVQMVNELSLVTKERFKSKNDDFSDTISQLPLIGAWAPSQDIPNDVPRRDVFDDLVPDRDQPSPLDSYLI